jgi:hypothetical protein
MSGHTWLLLKTTPPEELSLGAVSFEEENRAVHGTMPNLRGSVEVVTSSVEGVGDLLAHHGQHGDHDKCDQRNQQTILHQSLPFFFLQKTFHHALSPLEGKMFDAACHCLGYSTGACSSPTMSEVGFHIRKEQLLKIRVLFSSGSSSSRTFASRVNIFNVATMLPARILDHKCAIYFQTPDAIQAIEVLWLREFVPHRNAKPRCSRSAAGFYRAEAISITW